jgi:hypoxanthine phosphoribosyltransferase
MPSRVLVVDDAIDSGATMATVVEQLRDAVGDGGEVRTAVLTITTRTAVFQPDFTLYRQTLCRFPWSHDFQG